MSGNAHAAAIGTRSAHDADDSRLPRRTRGDCESCDLDPAQSAGESRGLAWVIGAFVICPCHLPITLAIAATLLGGTAAGAALRGHPIAAGALITAAWAVATWHGFRLLRKPVA